MDPAIISHRFHSTRKQFINAPRTQPDLLLSSDRFRGFSTPYTYIHTYLHTYTQRYEYEAALCCRISTNRSLKPAGHRKVGRCNVMCWIFNGTASDVGPGTFRLSRPYTTTYVYIYIHTSPAVNGVIVSRGSCTGAKRISWLYIEGTLEWILYKFSGEIIIDLCSVCSYCLTFFVIYYVRICWVR